MWARHAIVSHLRAGRTGDAERVLGWLDRCASRLPCRWPRIAALAGRAGLAEAGGDPQAAQDAFTEALALHDGLELPLERIETLLEFGTFLRRIGSSARARPLLAEAVAAAEAVGAHWLAGQAHQELAASGGRRRRRREMSDRLTPQERRVFELAAEGLSNDAIASRLRVSAGTIKTHLEHIYAKLGVHSRRELMLRRDDVPA
jgi:DNA-binding CsgD family transcriptional regulator